MDENTEMLRRIALANIEMTRVALRATAMLTENVARAQKGESAAYTEADFLAEEPALNYAASLLQL